ncbi:sulfotransferase 1B1-like isoform X2 [Littorina saxatilis]|uniref:Sulfotransferase domain-containing protein n=1 Tax=Littorina saxatilis TaxID=31220 RepID=A0AAN9AVC4_9CAEN
MPGYRYVPDGNGETLRLFESDGRVLPTHQVLTHWHEVTNMASRQDDVLLCGYAKSGVHWLWEILTMLTQGMSHLSTRRMEGNGLLMFASTAHLDSLPSPRVLVTHRLFHELPSDFILKRRKIVCVVRDPKDVCVSAYFMMKAVKHAEYEGTFGGFLKLFEEGLLPGNSWANWILSYEKGLKEHPELSVHVICYEQLKASPAKEIQRLAEYLGVAVPSGLVDAVASQTQFSHMKVAKDNLENPFVATYKDEKDAIFRKGEAGGWKDWFTPEQAEHFDQHIQKQLGRSSLEVQL